MQYISVTAEWRSRLKCGIQCVRCSYWHKAQVFWGRKSFLFCSVTLYDIFWDFWLGTFCPTCQLHVKMQWGILCVKQQPCISYMYCINVLFLYVLVWFFSHSNANLSHKSLAIYKLMRHVMNLQIWYFNYFRKYIFCVHLLLSHIWTLNYYYYYCFTTRQTEPACLHALGIILTVVSDPF